MRIARRCTGFAALCCCRVRFPGTDRRTDRQTRQRFITLRGPTAYAVAQQGVRGTQRSASSTGVDNGAGGPGPLCPGKKIFLLKQRDFQVSRDLMFNMYTCIAYLIEIRKFCLKTVKKVLILRPKML